MGNCIGKKSGAQNKQQKHTSSLFSTTKSHFNNQLSIAKNLSSSEQTTTPISHLSDIKESDTVSNNNEKNKEEVIQCLSSLLATTNDQYLFLHTPIISSPVQLSIQCKKFKSNNTVTDFSENSVTHQITLITNEEDTSMGHIFSKETEINNDQEVPKFTQEILSGKLNSICKIKFYLFIFKNQLILHSHHHFPILHFRHCLVIQHHFPLKINLFSHHLLHQLIVIPFNHLIPNKFTLINNL
jgi:hypothetical protein